MGLFAWNKKYDLSCPAIDDEHKRLFEMADKLHTAMAAGRGSDALKSLFDELVDYTRTHFRHEEALMRGSGYPGMPEHKREHDALGARVVELQKQAVGGRLRITLETMTFLREWLDQHICKSDRLVADYARQRMATSSARR
jgi:hemerythrin-like metal-binding protein